MHPRFAHLLYGISCICLIYALPIFAEEGCSLSDTSSSPIQSYKEKIDILNAFVRKQADASSCEASASPAARMDGSISLMKEVSSLGTSGTEFLDETGAFLDPAGPLNELQAHRENIEEIEQSILETAQYVGSRCARGQQVTEDALQGQGSAYDTRGRALSGILIEMAKETRETKRFFTILGQGMQTEEYIDEVPFPIASKGFSKDMYVYYSPKKLQECRDNSPRKQAMTDMIKNAFTAGWKYPQAMQVWKDAMARLLYRGSEGGGSSATGQDSQKERVLKAKRGGLGNSDIMINSQFFKEFGYRPDTKTTEESLQGLEKKTFYEKTGYDFIRRVLPSLTAQEGGPDGPGYIKSVQTTEELEKIARLEQLDASHYSQHNTREESLAKNSADARKNGTEFAQIIEGQEDGTKVLKELAKNEEDVLNMQATNIPGAVRDINAGEMGNA